MSEELNALHSDTNKDKRMQDILRQIADQSAARGIRATKNSKAKQLVLSQIAETEGRFQNRVFLDAVLAEYEQIVRAYEEQYKVKRTGFQFEAPSNQLTLPAVSKISEFSAPAHETPPTRATRKSQKQKAATPRSTRRAKSTGGVPKDKPFPTTGSKEDGAENDNETMAEAGTGPAEEEEEEEGGVAPKRALFVDAEGMEVDGSSSNNNNNNNNNKNNKRKRKEHVTAIEEVVRGDGEEAPETPQKKAAALKITEFKGESQRVKITNNSDAPIDLTGYRIRNCDYQVSQNFPSLVLPPGETFVIAARPKTGSGRASKFHMFWQDGEHGHFEKNGNGVRILGPNSEVVDHAK